MGDDFDGEMKGYVGDDFEFDEKIVTGGKMCLELLLLMLCVITNAFYKFYFLVFSFCTSFLEFLLS